MIGNSLLGPLFEGSAAARWGANNQLRLPRANLVVHIKNAYPFTDRIGTHDGPAQLRQFAEVTSGTVTLYHASIVGTETITSHGGTATVSAVAGGIVIGVGTAWEVRDSAGHFWTHCAALSATSVVMWDVSGLGDHLIARGLDEAVVTALCSTGRDLAVGTDWLDRGFTLADGTQYRDSSGQYIFPNDTVIPVLAAAPAAASWSWQWEPMFEDGDEIYVNSELAFEGV